VVYKRSLSVLWCVAMAWVATPAVAGTYGTAGCGLGSVVFGAEPGFAQVFAATTNGTSYTQTFGISSGTSNCVPAAKAAAFNSQRLFLEQNFASVAMDAAQGDGETLRGLAATLGCSDQAYPEVTSAIKAHHAAIFRAAGVDKVLFSMHKVLRSSEGVTTGCTNII